MRFGCLPFGGPPLPFDVSESLQDLPDAALALALSEAAAGGSVLFVDATGGRIERLAALAAGFADGLEVLALPAWDTLPYDRTPPSPAVVGQRVHALARLAEAPEVRRLIVASARALLQRVPAPGHWGSARLRLAPGVAVDAEALRPTLAAFGYHVDEHVDRAGEVAMRGQVIDLFPGDAAGPVRVEVQEGVVATLHAFDPLTQRSVGELEELVLRPVVEAAPPAEQVEAEAERIAHPDAAGGDARVDGEADGRADEPPAPADPALLGASFFDYLGDVRVLVHPEAGHRLGDIEEEVAGAYEAALIAARVAGRGASLPKPARLYVRAKDVMSRLEALPGVAVSAGVAEAVPAARDVGELARQAGGGDGRVVIAAGAGARAVAAALKRRGVAAGVAGSWREAAGADGPVCVGLDVAEGFARDGLRVLAAPGALRRGGRAAGSGERQGAGFTVEEPPRVSDIVVHAEHGVCQLTGLRTVGDEERLALAFHEGTELLVPVSDLSRLWRYGSEAGRVTLDRLHGEAWHKRRAEIEAEVAETAAALAAAAAERARTKAPAIKPGTGYSRVVERFAYAPSPDQAAAIEAVLADLAAGRPMDRLVCGDVGFGKTEVAIRAAAAVALAGYQVAIVAPTTVLARQHLDVFRRRLAGTGVRVEPLLRGAAGAGAKAVRAGLADGSIGVVVGTEAIASDKVAFKKLGLVVIDEEQRFGDADKRKLTRLRDGRAVHAMVMSATPIPRTLQAAMVGLRDISTIATAPVRRQPTRTFVLPWSEAAVREALTREHRRGGQSFVVAPRIEDLGPLEEALRAWAPELSLATAHGRLKPEVLEEMVAAFAAGETDVLLATNIIEAGLDIPRANTILITGPHRFGLSQLHQMRGRVGRGARRGLAYVLTDPAVPLPAPTARRLRTLEMAEGLGAGFAIAAADMDARGAGELFGEKQAGHVHAIGTELYQHILGRELARIEGAGSAGGGAGAACGGDGADPGRVCAGAECAAGVVPAARAVGERGGVEDFVAELEDRFGPAPAAAGGLIDLARLAAWCRGHGVTRVDAGPKAVALTAGAAAAALAGQLGAEAKGERVLLHVAGATGEERLAGFAGVPGGGTLTGMAGGGRPFR